MQLSLLIKASFCRRWTLLQKAPIGQNAENVYLGPQPHLIHLCHSPYMYDSGNIKDKRGVKISMPQRTKMSALRWYLLYMTWKLHPWNLNNMVAQTKPKQWHQQLTCQQEWGKSHNAPPLEAISHQWLLKWREPVFPRYEYLNGYPIPLVSPKIYTYEQCYMDLLVCIYIFIYAYTCNNKN